MAVAEHKGADVFLIVAEVAKRLRVSQETVRRYLRDGELPGVRLTRRAGWRVRESALDAWVEGRITHRGGSGGALN